MSEPCLRIAFATKIETRPALSSTSLILNSLHNCKIEGLQRYACLYLPQNALTCVPDYGNPDRNGIQKLKFKTIKFQLGFTLTLYNISHYDIM